MVPQKSPTICDYEAESIMYSKVLCIKRVYFANNILIKNVSLYTGLWKKKNETVVLN